jgi:hypothetical protein
MATGVVSSSSDLIRKRWMMEGLLQANSKSFWAPYTGGSSESIIHQVNNENADNGHTVTFDYDGNTVAKAIKGKDTAYGKGEQKKKFSETITVDRYRLVVDNGDKFDAVNIGDLSISQHGHSRALLADQFIRFKDQSIFDAAQGITGGTTTVTTCSHRIYYDGSSTPISYGTLAGIEKTLQTGAIWVTGTNELGYATGTLPDTAAAASSVRAPLEPFRLEDGRSIWLLVVDPFTAHQIKANTVANSGITALAQHADLRGNNNRVFKGIIGQIGSLVIVEAQTFFGSCADFTSAAASTGLDVSNIEVAGLRGFDGTRWSGEASYAGAPTYSRNLILGANALQMAFGKQPDYKFQASQDFGIKSESACEFWMNTQKVNLTAENEDYDQAKRASMDNGVVAFDVKL